VELASAFVSDLEGRTCGVQTIHEHASPRCLLAQKPWIVPIPGTTKLHRLEENIGAASVELTPDDLNDIETAASKIIVQGARYPEKLEQMTGR